jgi:ABC-type transport system involved in multi-copper enzyme maturation permease subunit
VRSAFLIAWRGLWRGKTLWTLLAAVVAFHFLLPGLVRSDGTDAGAFEMTVRIVFGAVFAVVCAASLAIGGGMFAREREDDLLPLSLVRPMSAFSIAVGRWLAVVLLFALVLAVNAVLVNIVPQKGGFAPPDCRVHVGPALPPAEVSAALAMEAFLKKDTTPEAVKKSPRAAILALLTAKENERYEVVRPGQTVSWPFAGVPSGPLAVKTRFSTMYSMKAPLNGVFRFNGCEGIVSNNTQAVLEVPLVACMTANTNGNDLLSFTNTGGNDVMLRPRRDMELLVPGDSFKANSIRASLEMLALAGLLAAFGLFLSAALSRPVALFTAAVLLAATMMAPDAVSQFPDEFNATTGEKVGLAISRAVMIFSSAFSDVSPVSDLASGKAIVSSGLFRAMMVDLVLLPAPLLALAAFLLRRKTK